MLNCVWSSKNDGWGVVLLSTLKISATDLASVEVKKTWVYTSSPPYIFMLKLVTHRENLPFGFYWIRIDVEGNSHYPCGSTGRTITFHSEGLSLPAKIQTADFLYAKHKQKYVLTTTLLSMADVHTPLLYGGMFSSITLQCHLSV
jgi:hypothetical protein